MSTEQKPATEPKAEPNALATTLTGGWEKFKQGKLLSYQLMALILVLVAGLGITVYIMREKRKTESAKWAELDGLGSLSSLDEFSKKYPNTTQGKLSDLNSASLLLERYGINQLGASDPKDRKTAVENIEKAREAFTKLVDEFKDDPLIKPLCLYGRAKAEATLVGMLKEGQTEQFRGDPKKAIEWLDQVAEATPETDLGKDCKKLADTLRNQNTQQQVQTLQTMVYSIPTVTLPDPKFPFDPSKMPKDAAHGFPFGP